MALDVTGQVGSAGLARAPRPRYLPIAEHGLIGDLHKHGALFRSPDLELSLSTRCPLEIVDGVGARPRIALQAGETATFVLDRVEPGEGPVPYLPSGKTDE